MTGLGWNIDGLFLSEQERQKLLSAMKANPPSVVTILTNLGYALEVQRALPKTKVVYRTFWGDQYDTLWVHTSPDQFLNIYSDAIKSGLIVYTSNEPHMSQNLVDWEIEVGTKIIERNGKACLFNWAVGAPNTGDNEYAQWRKAIKLIGDNRGKLFLGLHEYFFGHPFMEFGLSANTNTWPDKIDGFPWVMGRYKHILDYCDRNGLKRPAIILTEYGYDQVGAVAQIYQNTVPNYKPPMLLHNAIGSLEIWGRQEGKNWVDYSYTSFRKIWDVMYKDSTDVIGACFFPYGGVNIWHEASIHRYPDLVKKLSDNDFSTKYVDNIIPISEEIAGMKIGDFKRVRWSGGAVNLRKNGSLSGEKLAVISKNMVGFVFPQHVVTKDGYTWTLGMFVDNNNGMVLGWFASSLSTATYDIIP